MNLDVSQGAFERTRCSGVSSESGKIRETKETSGSQVPQNAGLLSKTLIAILSSRTCWLRKFLS